MEPEEAARRTLQARQDPLVRRTIAAAFARLGIADPDGHILDAIAGHPLSPVVDGIAVFEAKRAAGSLPRDLEMPGRYLLGIVRNIAEQREGELISDAMLGARLEAQDALLAPLVQRRHRVEAHNAAAPQTLSCFVDYALEAGPQDRPPLLALLRRRAHTPRAGPRPTLPLPTRRSPNQHRVSRPVPRAPQGHSLACSYRAAIRMNGSNEAAAPRRGRGTTPRA